MVRVPDVLPPEVGEKLTGSVQDAPGLKEDPPVEQVPLEPAAKFAGKVIPDMLRV